MAVVIDTHQHFWDLSLLDYPWMPEGESPLRRNRLPDDLAPLLRESGVDRTVTVQAHSSLDETRWLLRLAAETDYVAGVVGWVDLADPDVGRTLDELLADPYLKGIRHIWHDEPDDAWILRPDVVRGLRELASRDVPYDLLPRPQHLPYIPRLLEQVPGLRTVIDHIAKPLIGASEVEPWLTDLRAVASIPGVHCKVSGMVTEADHASWTPDDLKPYVAHVVELFGYDRLMFGSDWPVCTLAGSYGQVFAAAEAALGPIPDEARAAVFGGNAVRFYGLSQPDAPLARPSRGVRGAADGEPPPEPPPEPAEDSRGVIADLRARVGRAEAAERTFRRLIESLNDGYLVVQDGVIAFASERAREMTGYGRGEGIGRALQDFLAPEVVARTVQIYGRVQAGEPLNEPFETVGLTSDGTRVPIELSYALTRYDDGPAVAVLIRDITARKRSEAAEREASRNLVRLIGQAMELRDPYTRGHSERVGTWARAIVAEMGGTPGQQEEAYLGGLVHDAGKIALPQDILARPGALSAEEFALIRTHTIQGAEMLAQFVLPWDLAAISRQHHERMDGSGYPGGLRGDDICSGARAVMVADVVEAITSHRPYRPAKPLAEALEEVRTPGRYDPDVVEACLRCLADGRIAPGAG